MDDLARKQLEEVLTELTLLTDKIKKILKEDQSGESDNEGKSVEEIQEENYKAMVDVTFIG